MSMPVLIYSSLSDHLRFLCRNQTCSKRMPGSLGHEEQDAKTFASWVYMMIHSFESHFAFLSTYF